MTSDDALAEKLRFLQNAMGAVPTPFDCFLVLRGLKTLPVRMERHAQSAMKVASWLRGHRDVARVHYPGPGSPQHARAPPDGAAGDDLVRDQGRRGGDGGRPLAGLPRRGEALHLRGEPRRVEVAHRAAGRDDARLGARGGPRGLLGIDDGLHPHLRGARAVDDLLDDLAQAF